MKLLICKSCKNNGCTYMGTDTLINPCEDYVPTKMTNGDRIRAMTDEELAKVVVCPHKICESEMLNCGVCILKWLKQEVEDAVD